MSDSRIDMEGEMKEREARPAETWEQAFERLFPLSNTFADAPTMFRMGWDAHDALAAPHPALDVLSEVLERLLHWDHLDGSADGPFWRREIENALAKSKPDMKNEKSAKVEPRRLFDDTKPDGYLESDRDYVMNNLELAVWLLDRETEHVL